jgi:hypothetical protein
MLKKFVVLSVCALVAGGFIVAGVTSAATNAVTLDGHSGSAGAPIKHQSATETTEQLFRGDLVPEIGLGCSNPTGNSGGPNDWAVGVVATLVPPFDIISTTYNLFTQISPNINQLDFRAWAGGGVPGAQFGSQSGLPFASGNHTVAISPAINVSTANAPGGQFYFGLNNAQTNVGIRVGEDTNSGSAGTSFIRAPICGASSFVTVDSLLFPGNWVMAAVIDDGIPVELMNFSVE